MRSEGIGGEEAIIDLALSLMVVVLSSLGLPLGDGSTGGDDSGTGGWPTGCEKDVCVDYISSCQTNEACASVWACISDSYSLGQCGDGKCFETCQTDIELDEMAQRLLASVIACEKGCHSNGTSTNTSPDPDTNTTCSEDCSAFKESCSVNDDCRIALECVNQGTALGQQPQGVSCFTPTPSLATRFSASQLSNRLHLLVALLLQSYFAFFFM